jgi:hypothetical protein
MGEAIAGIYESRPAGSNPLDDGIDPWMSWTDTKV